VYFTEDLLCRYGPTIKTNLRLQKNLQYPAIFLNIFWNIDVPDHSALSRRGKIIDILSRDRSDPNESLVIIVDSTGLRIYGIGEMIQESRQKKAIIMLQCLLK